jgi:hypothetical protein
MTHSIPNLHSDWITDRLPTAADADVDGDVCIPLAVNAAMNGPGHSLTELGWAWARHGLIVPGQPWWSEKAAANPTPPATSPAPAPTRKVVQIEAAQETKNCYSGLYALHDDNSIYEIVFRPGMPEQWRQLPPIPQPK